MEEKEDAQKSTTGQESLITEEQESFNRVVHYLLIIGLVVSVVFILTGLVIALANQQPVPHSMVPLGEIVSQMVRFEAAGFITLGLLVLIATPVMRVILSAVTFIVEKDWRFTGITLIVLATVLVSIILGKE